jgi:hypothetical protein
LLGLVALAQAELGRASREAAAQNKRLATLSVSSELRFESAEQRARFAEELRRAVVDVVGRFASPYAIEDGSAGAGRPFRLILGCYPIPPQKEIATEARLPDGQAQRHGEQREEKH